MSTENQKQLIQLPPNALQQLEQVSLNYDAVVHQGVKREDVLVPGFWAHHAVKLRPFDEIRVRSEDGTWMAKYLVLDCSRTWAKVKELTHYNLGTADVSLTQASESEVQAFIEQHEVKYRGPHKWSILRKADNAVLFEGITQKEEATAKLEAHARAQVGTPAAAKEQPVTA